MIKAANIIKADLCVQDLEQKVMRVRDCKTLLKLDIAEKDCLSAADQTRDLLLNACTAPDDTQTRDKLIAVYGGDCLRIASMRIALECMPVLSDRNVKDPRINEALGSIETVEGILRDKGFSKILVNAQKGAALRFLLRQRSAQEGFSKSLSAQKAANSGAYHLPSDIEDIMESLRASLDAPRQQPVEATKTLEVIPAATHVVTAEQAFAAATADLDIEALCRMLGDPTAGEGMSSPSTRARVQAEARRITAENAQCIAVAQILEQQVNGASAKTRTPVSASRSRLMARAELAPRGDDAQCRARDEELKLKCLDKDYDAEAPGKMRLRLRLRSFFGRPVRN